MPNNEGGLEIEQDLDFQQKEWTIQRISWVAMAVVVLLTLIGLLGHGPLSAQTRRAEGIEVSYWHYVHQTAPTDLEILVAPEALVGGQARVWIDQGYAKAARVSDITPQPESVESSAERVLYTFQAEDPLQPVRVIFNMRLDSIGTLDGSVGLEDGASVTFEQLVYP